MKAITSALALMLFSISSFAADMYKVNAKIAYQNETIASPKFSVLSGKKASFSTDDSYTFDVLVTPTQDNIVEVQTALTLRDFKAAPKFKVYLNKPATMTFGDLALDIRVDEVASK